MASARQFIFLFFFLFSKTYFLGQTSVSGYVIDEKGERLPYVNIGIKSKNIGTCSTAEGMFSITVPEKYKKDTLTFSMIGYKDSQVPVSNLKSNNENTIQLKPTSLILKEVTVTTKKLVEKKFGITKNQPMIHIVDASIQQNDIFEIGQLVHLPPSKSKITSVNLFIYESRKDSGIFRINFYSTEKGKPNYKLNKKEILITKAIKEGWLQFDLSNEKMYLNNDVVVAIEFIPSQAGGIKYEVKVGGGSKSFVRTNSLGQWQVPPHHYRVYVTALVTNEKNSTKELDEEIESVPLITMHSKNITDSIFLFVSLPKDYSKNKAKKYPVVYLLDANLYFDFLKGNPEQIIVGIGYKNIFLADSLRERDYTFPKASIADSMRLSGGAADFLNFIKNELIPLVDKGYNTDTTRRTLMGHSLGGYFTLYALSCNWHGKGSFNRYVAASPSLDYANDYLLDCFKSLSDQKTISKELLITIGEEEKLAEFPVLITLFKKTSLKMHTNVFPKMGHMETAVITFRAGLK